jgi:hypothetical protein
VKRVLLLGSYGCIFHGTGNLAWLCQNFGISGGFEPAKPPSPLGRPLTYFDIRGAYVCFMQTFFFLILCNNNHNRLNLTSVLSATSKMITDYDKMLLDKLCSPCGLPIQKSCQTKPEVP